MGWDARAGNKIGSLPFYMDNLATNKTKQQQKRTVDRNTETQGHSRRKAGQCAKVKFHPTYAAT